MKFSKRIFMCFHLLIYDWAIFYCFFHWICILISKKFGKTSTLTIHSVCFRLKNWDSLNFLSSDGRCSAKATMKFSWKFHSISNMAAYQFTECFESKILRIYTHGVSVCLQSRTKKQEETMCFASHIHEKRIHTQSKSIYQCCSVRGWTLNACSHSAHTSSRRRRNLSRWMKKK